MTIEDKRAKLTSIKIIIANPVYSEDMGMQYDILTGNGAYTEMGSVGQWPYIRFKVSEDLRGIQKSILAGKRLSEPELLENKIIKELCTYHSFLYDSFLVEGDNLTKCLQLIRDGLKTIDLSVDYIYAFVSVEDWDIDIRFYSTYDTFADAIRGEWDNSIESYDDMSDDEIDYWFGVAEENDWDGIPYASFEEE